MIGSYWTWCLFVASVTILYIVVIYQFNTGW